MYTHPKTPPRALPSHTHKTHSLSLPPSHTQGAMSVCGWVKYRNFGSDRYSRIIGLGNGAEYENIYVAHRERGPDLKFSIRQGTDSRALYVGNFWELNTWQ